MNDIGIRDLKTHASSIVRRVWKKHDRFTVTHRGHPVGMIVPFDIQLDQQQRESSSAWDEIERLNARITAGWKSKKSSVRILSDMRR